MTAIQPLRRRVFVVAALGLLTLLTHRTFAGSGDEPHYLAIANSLAFDRDLDLSNNYHRDEWIVGAADPALHVTIVDGKMRPLHDIGMPLLFVPYVAMMQPLVRATLPLWPVPLLERLRVGPATIYRHVLSLAMIALTLVLLDQLLAACMAVGIVTRIAVTIVLVAAWSPPLSIFSILFFTEILSALLCLVAFKRLVIDRADGAAGWALAGLCTGLLWLVHARNIGGVLALMILSVVQHRRSPSMRALLAFWSIALLMLAARTAVNYWLWGTWLTSPHASLGVITSVPETISVAIHRLAGMLVDQEFGLLPYAPIFVLTAFAVTPGNVDRVALIGAGFVALAYLLPILLPITNVHGFEGGWTPPARFWVPVLPLIAIATAAGASRAPRGLFILIVTVQIIITAYFWYDPKSLWNDGDGTAAVCQRTGAGFCRHLPSLIEARTR